MSNQPNIMDLSTPRPDTSLFLTPRILSIENRIMQLISSDGTFNSNIIEEIKSWRFLDKVYDYFIVAVLGCQSSGKSTLLNMLFGTEFQVLDAKKEGRKQTTMGVWMGRSGSEDRVILVFDVEGTDSKERGEDHAVWERKTSLFSLALSEILIINMWTHDVGRFEGANYGLLKIVFEINLKLFHSTKKNKTLLYFIFRDHNEDEDGSLDNIARTITNDLKTLWASMPKPDKSSKSLVTDYFDFKFCTLAHKLLKKDFENGVNELRHQFLEPNHEHFILDPKYKTDVPADGFPAYASKIWETILTEKDLDLPSQKQMLAMYRCEEISKEAFLTFSKQVDTWKDSLATGKFLDNFGDKGTTATDKALHDYDESAKRYDNSVMEEKRKDLLSKIGSSLQVLFGMLVKQIMALSKDRFSKDLAQALPENEFVHEFGDRAKEIEKDIMCYFKEMVSHSTVPQFNWSTKSEEEDLTSYIHTRLAQEREKQLDIIGLKKKEKVHKEMSKKLAKFFEKPDEHMWKNISIVFQNVETESVKELEEILKNFSCSAEEISKRLKIQQENIFSTLKVIIKEKANNLDILMNSKFRSEFDFNKEGVPRQWHPGDDINGIWSRAMVEAEKLIDLFFVIRLSEEDQKIHFYKTTTSGVELVDVLPDVNENNYILTSSEGDRYLERFRTMAKVPYQEAKREIEHATSSGSIPMYFLALLFILGWNEMWFIIQMVLFNPLGLVLFIVLAGVAYSVWALNLFPVIQVMFGGVWKEAKSYIAFKMEKWNDKKTKKE